jgi:hypothetical protein
MFEWIFDFVGCYQQLIKTGWANLGPKEYVALLSSVGGVGWYLMLKGNSTKC